MIKWWELKLPARSSINVTPSTLLLLHLQDSRHSTASLKFIFGCGCLAHGLNYRKGRTSSCKELTATVLLLNGWWLPLSAVLRVRAFTNSGSGLLLSLLSTLSRLSILPPVYTTLQPLRIPAVSPGVYAVSHQQVSCVVYGCFGPLSSSTDDKLPIDSFRAHVGTPSRGLWLSPTNTGLDLPSHAPTTLFSAEMASLATTTVSNSPR